MAIASDILLAMQILPSRRGDKGLITLSNSDARFPQRKIILDRTNPREPVHIDATTLGTSLLMHATNTEWSNYFKAGYLGHTTYLPLPTMPNLNVLITGSIPPGSGLSSSAAMVVSSLLASLLSSLPPSPTLPKRKIVELAMVAERNVGVNCGGMDQAASVFGQRRKAILVTFSPQLNEQMVEFPPDGEVFVIANSLVNADKHTSGPENYNLRVVETTCAAEVLARKLELGGLHERDGFGGTLEEVVRLYYKGKEIPVEDRLEKFQSVVADTLPGNGEYTQSELASLMGLSEPELVKKYMTKFPGPPSIYVTDPSEDPDIQITPPDKTRVI
jgi:galactokinase